MLATRLLALAAAACALAAPAPAPANNNNHLAPRQSSGGFPQPPNGAHREFYIAKWPIRLALNYTGGAKPNFRKPPDGTAVIIADAKFDSSGRPNTPYTWSTWRATNGWKGVVKQYDSDEMCLDVGHGPRIGSKVKVWYCHGAAWQQFEVDNFQLKVAGTDLCVGYQRGDEGQQAELLSCSQGVTRWNAEPNKPFDYLPPTGTVSPSPTSTPLPTPSNDARRQFWAPGSTLRLAVDRPDNPNLTGQPEDGTSILLRDSVGNDGEESEYRFATWRAANGWRGVIKSWDWSSKCLDAGPDPTLGSRIFTNSCVGGVSQTWVVSTSKIQLADTGFCVGTLGKSETSRAELVSCQDDASTNWNDAPVNPPWSSSTPPPSTTVPPPSSTVPPSSLTSSYPQPSGGAHREFYAPDTTFRLALDYTGGAPIFRRPPDGTKVQARDGRFNNNGYPTTSYTWSTWRAVDGWRGVIKQYDTDEMCLDAGPNPTLNSKIVVNGCRGGASQTWLVSGSKIQLADTGFCVGLVNKQEGYQAELLSCQDNARTNWNQRPNQPVNPISSSASPSANSYSPTPQPTPSGSLPPPTSLPPPSSSVPPPSSSQSPQPSSTTTTGFPQPSGGAHREFYVYNSPFRLALNYTGGGNPRKPPDGTAVIYADGKFVDGRPTTQYTRTTFRATDGWRGVVKQYDSDEMCLDVGHGPRLGSRVKVWYCHGAAWQQFWVTKWKLQVANTNLCVGWESYPQEGLQATLIDCSRISTSFNQGPNQKWHA